MKKNLEMDTACACDLAGTNEKWGGGGLWGELLRVYGERGMDLGIRGGDERSAHVCVPVCV